MSKACDLARNSVVSINGVPHVVEELRVTTPSARGASSLYRFRFRNLVTKGKLDQTCKGDDRFDDADFERREVQFLFAGPGEYTFMDQEDFTQFTIDADALGEQALYLTEDMEDIRALIVDGRAVTIDLPVSVTLKVVSCDPSVRGQSATARTKPATLATGLVVQVPEYLATGEQIRVDTRTGEFLGRA